MTQLESGPKTRTRANKVIITLQKLGLAVGPMQVLGLRGRKTGILRELPVAVVSIGGQRYIFQAYPKASWVLNARAADTARLRRGRRTSTVRLVELPVPERAAILPQLVTSDPRVGKAFVQNGMATSLDPATVTAAAPRTAVFRIEPA
jgi:deazaflavin-dependent oxidoreductase (nitroreductase family)